MQVPIGCTWEDGGMIIALPRTVYLKAEFSGALDLTIKPSRDGLKNNIELRSSKHVKA
jgi:hypothetical protein